MDLSRYAATRRPASVGPFQKLNYHSCSFVNKPLHKCFQYNVVYLKGKSYLFHLVIGTHHPY
jgi:hypothetical protein